MMNFWITVGAFSLLYLENETVADLYGSWWSSNMMQQAFQVAANSAALRHHLQFYLFHSHTLALLLAAAVVLSKIFVLLFSTQQNPISTSRNLSTTYVKIYLYFANCDSNYYLVIVLLHHHGTIKNDLFIATSTKKLECTTTFVGVGIRYHQLKWAIVQFAIKSYIRRWVKIKGHNFEFPTSQFWI